MTQFIKKFIEKNIDQIEDGKWDEVFLNWYNDSAEIWLEDEEELKQLLNILLTAGIEPNMSSRYSVLYDELVWMLENLKDDLARTATTPSGRQHVGRFYLINRLNTKLGYTDEEVHKIMDDAASSLGMNYTDFYGGGYTW